MRGSVIAPLIFGVVIVAAALTGKSELPPLSGREEFKNLSRGDVFFPHERHHEWGVSCFHCHHRSTKNGETVMYDELIPGSPAVSCISCHGAGRELERVHHRMCISCHRDLKNKNVHSGPVTCGRCHIAKEK